MKHILTTNKPWILLIFALAVVNIIGLLFALGGYANPLAIIDTSNTIFMPSVITTTPSATGATAAINMVVLLSLALWVVIAYGISQGHTWTWWLLTFQTIITLVAGVLGFLTAQPVVLIPFIVNLVIFAALFKKETVAEFDPNLKILPANGLW